MPASLPEAGLPPPRFNAPLPLLLMTALMLASTAASAPLFTRITDPTNPVVTEPVESGGGSWIDLDGDGFLDLFVANGNLSNQNNSLYLHTTGMSFVRVVTGAIVTDGGSSIGGVWGDWDRDGIPDLFVTNRNNFGNFLYHGLGDTTFAKVTTGQVVTDIANSNSASWIDIDGDGDLDLYVLNFNGEDYLYLNGGPPDFTLTRTLVPTLTPGTEFSIHGAWADFDQDGDPDLYAGNAGTQNDYLFVNGGGLTFTKRVLSDARSTLGGSWGDFDNDGDLDLFVAMYQNQASILYRNDGPPDYTLTPVPTSVYSPDAANSVGSAWADADNDGDLDLFVANDGQNNAYYENSGPPNYTLTRVLTGAEVTDGGNSFGCGWADVDRDGDLDLFVANRLNQPNFLYRNDGPSGAWLGVRCVGTTSNIMGVGARVRIHATIAGVPRWQMQEVTPLTGYNSQNLELHFGLGDATVADSMIVEWPSGLRESYPAIPANRLLTIVEGQPLAAAESQPGPAMRLVTRNPFRTEAEVEYTLERPSRVSLDVVDVSGRRVASLVDGVEAAGAHRARFQPPSQLGAGLYWLRFQGPEGRSAVRVAFVR